MNTFKGPKLVNSVPEELWMEVHNIVKEAANKTIPKKKKSKKAKWLSEETLQIKERSEKQRRKGKVYLTKSRFPKNSMERQKGLQFTVDDSRRKQQKISSGKLEISREHFA